jgi:hypothetical protein
MTRSRTSGRGCPRTRRPARSIRIGAVLRLGHGRLAAGRARGRLAARAAGAIRRYTANCSLDGYVKDASGGFAWGDPSAEALEAITALEGGSAPNLYGRTMYETMRVW